VNREAQKTLVKIWLQKSENLRVAADKLREVAEAVETCEYHHDAQRFHDESRAWNERANACMKRAWDLAGDPERFYPDQPFLQ